MLKGTGRKRRFLGYGALNVLVTNLVLQLLLWLFPAGELWLAAATLLSQSVNVALGFVLYGKKVFRVDRLQKRSAARYLLMALLLWWANWAGISGLAAWGLSRNLAALLLIPVLAAASYTLQKLVVFRQPPTAAMLK
jgi:putative flippase GtrA